MRKLLVFALLLLLCGAAAHAITYELRIGDKVFQTRYRPFLAEFDSSLLMFLSDQSNWTVVPVEGTVVVALEEEAGYGHVIDDKTLMIGFTENDKPTPEEEAAMLEEEAQNQSLQPPRPYSMPTVGEPNQGGGIPLGFINQTTPPLGGGPS